MHVVLGRFVGMYIGEYEYQGEMLPVLDCFWIARVVSGVIRIDPLESSEYAWLPVHEPPRLAFETMDSALTDAALLLGLTI